MPDAYPPVTGHDGVPRPRWWHHGGMRMMAALAPGWRLYDEVHRHTEYDPQLLRSVQGDRLRALLGPAAAGADPFDALAAQPVTHKRDFAVPGHLSTGRIDGIDALRVRTSGTTGDPIVIEHDDAHLVENVAAMLRMLAAYGLDPGVRLLRVTCDRRHGLVSFGPPGSNVTTVQLRLNVSKMDEGNAGFVNRLCREFAPAVIWGQPMEVVVAAAKVRAGLFADPGPAMIWTHGDTLGPQTRAALREVFAVPVRDLYGLQEFGQIAWECPAAGGMYHLNEERVLAERADDGALVMTNLVTTATRIVRYRPEDRAEILDAPCPCGRALRRLSGIRGRQRAFMVDRCGNAGNVKPLQVALDALPVARWQVRQQVPGEITVILVPDATGADLDTAELAGRYATMMDLDTVRVRLAGADELMTERGKAPQFRLYATQERYAAGLVTG